MCVEAYPNSQLRSEIMTGLESIYSRLIGLNITGEMWVDGSFLTQKEEPDDVDVVVFVPSVFFDAGSSRQQEFLNWLGDAKSQVKALFSCHSDSVAEYDSRSAYYPLYLATRSNYEDIFGHSVATREPKGIITVSLKPAAQTMGAR